MQRHFRLGGGVAPRTTSLRGQGLIEYVLIAAVIGLLVVFAGPQVSGAIRNQFNQVSTTLDSGTDGGFGGGASGGSTGADSATVKAAVAKDAEDWTLDEQKAVAEDIAAKGEASPAYAKAMAAMDSGTEWSVKLTNGETLEYRIIGINHDDLADGSGKAGLTFLTTSKGIRSRMNATKNNAGGWEKSELRQKMNSGEAWNLMPSDFQTKVKSVRKLTNNVGGGSENKNATMTATPDRLFLLSYSEVVHTSRWASDYPWTSSEGTQYEAFKGKVSNNYSGNAYQRVAAGGGSVRCIRTTLLPSSLPSPAAMRHTTAARRTRIASAPLGASSFLDEKPARPRAGFSFQDFSLLAAQRPALNHPLRGWRQTALQSHPSDRY